MSRRVFLFEQGMFIGVQWWEAPESTIAILISVHVLWLWLNGGGIIVVIFY